MHELKTRLIEKWNKLNQKIIDVLVKSTLATVQHCREHCARSIRHLLNSCPIHAMTTNAIWARARLLTREMVAITKRIRIAPLCDVSRGISARFMAEIHDPGGDVPEGKISRYLRVKAVVRNWEDCVAARKSSSLERLLQVIIHFDFRCRGCSEINHRP
jgi:hypothetical protein